LVVALGAFRGIVGGMLLRREVLAALPFAVLVLSCKGKAPVDEKRSAVTASNATPLQNWDSIDPAFNGCAGACGLHSAHSRSQARAQPGASNGDTVFCPVSGAVFRVHDQSPRRVSHGTVLYFCCDGCAAFFSNHKDEVLAKRRRG
jgi:hypothetical protein